MLLRSHSRAGLDPRLAARHQVRRRDAHDRRLELFGEAPLLEQVGPRGVAVEHHDRRAQLQPCDERVPHHPRCRREPQQATAGLEVPAEPQVLAVLDQLAAVAVHDRLGQPGRARREQNVDRVVERDLLELERRALGRQVVPADSVGDLRLSERHPDHVLDRRDPTPDRLDLRPPVDVAVAVAVAADRDQHARLDLGEPVDDAAGAELGRARGPDRAEARGRDEPDQRLGDVRHVRDNAIALLHTEALKARADPPGLLDQLAERELARPARLRARHHRHPVAVLLEPDQVLRVVETRSGEPLRARHRAGPQHALVRRRRGSRRSPTARPRIPRGRRPTSDTSRRRRRTRARARRAASS